MENNIPQGAIPVEQFEAASDETHSDSGAIPVSQFEPAESEYDISGLGTKNPTKQDLLNDLQQEEYGGTGQQVLAGIEGAGRGVAGPLATLAERAIGVPKEDIQGREEANPITAGVSEAGGLGLGLLTGTGEAAVMTKAGKMAVEAANLSKPLTFGSKIGSAAVQQAAEMALLQTGTEIHKALVSDVPFSAESAITDVGLAAALGGIGGAGIGSISPLWSATAGPKVESLLNQIKSHVNGGAIVLPEAREAALKTLDIEVDPMVRAGISDNARARDYFGTLGRKENVQIQEGVDKLYTDVSNKVADSLGVKPEDMIHYDKNTAGHSLFDTFEKEYKTKYEPVADALQKRNSEAAGLPLADNVKYDQYNKILERGMEKLRPGSEYYKVYEKYANEILPLENIGHLDQLKTEIGNKIKGLKVGGDFNEINALNDIKSMLGDFQESQITRLGRSAEKEGIEGARSESSKLINERADVNRNYAEFASMSDELSNHLGVGDFRGFKTLTNKLENKVTAESLLNKFSVKNNADLIPFLQQHFPETLQKVLENERKDLLKQAFLQAAKKGDLPIDINKLDAIIKTTQAGKAGYVDALFPKEVLEKIEAAKTLISSLPSPKNSGTPAGLAKIFEHLPTSALATVGWFTGHGPVASILIGETASRLGVKGPEAYKMAYLKFLGSEAPAKAEGFKAAIDYINSAVKGATMMQKAVINVLKPGSMVIATHLIPGNKEREKLDKIINKLDENPEGLLNLAKDSHTGHYLPNQQTALTAAQASAAQYLQSIKPRSFQASPLDKPIEPSKEQTARYNRALDIAQQPAIILQHIKDGTLQITDIQDLKAMYPATYNQMTQQLSNAMISAESNEENIPFKTRMSLSLFLGQPVDSSMTPESIMSAQPKPVQNQPPNAPMKNKKGTSSLGKSNNSYMTKTQSAEADRHNR